MPIYISEQLKSMLKAGISYNTQTMSDVLSLTWLQFILHCINFFCCHRKNHPLLLADMYTDMYENKQLCTFV